MIEFNEDQIIDNELTSMKDWIVDIPKTQKELDSRFSLKNDEVHIDEVDFSYDYVEECDLFRVEIPTSQNDLKRYFI